MAYDSSGVENTRLRANRTFICSVVFLDIVEYSQKPVVEQINLKERFNAILAESLKDIPVSDRIILDTGDGAAIGFLSDPEDALFVAMSIRDALNIEQGKTDLLIRMGINLGPVKIVKDINKQMNLIGDGINVAQRIMSFADPGQLLVSRSYYDIVSCLSQEYAQLFQYKGSKADKHIREHDIYSVENTGLRPTYLLHHPEKKTKPDTAKSEPAAAIETSPPIDVVSAQALDKGTKKNRAKNTLLIGIPLVIILFVAAVFLIPRTQDKSPVPAVVSKTPAKMAKTVRAVQKAEEKEKIEEPRIAEKKMEEKNVSHKVAGKNSNRKVVEKNSSRKVEEENVSHEEKVRSSSVKADEIVFTSAGVKRSDEDVTISVRIHNTAAIAKSVALYDDYVRWPKSKLTDQTGKINEVNKVIFVKDSQTFTSQTTGTQGLMLKPGETASVSLTFKKTGKGIKNFALHPFIYVGRSWKEHDLPLKVGF